MATRRAKSTEGSGWPPGAAALAASLLAVGPAARALVDGAAAEAAVDYGLSLALAPLVVLGIRRAVEGVGPAGRGAALAAGVVAVAAAVHVAAGAAIGVLLDGARWSADRFAALTQAAVAGRLGAVVLGFAALAVFDRLLRTRRRLAERDDALAAARRHADALASRGSDVARRLKDEAERRGRFERIHRTSRLEALRARLRPGFLVGVVDRARAAATDDPPRAERMLLRLSLLLRTALRDGEADLVPLSEEIERTDAVLELERERLGKRLRYRFDVPEELLDDLVPALILPPLVLRAVAAGPGASKRGGTVEVRAALEDRALRLEVQDDVSAAVPAEEARRDPELAALGERLRILYGKDARVRSGARAEGGTRMVIELPRVAGVAREAS